MLDSAPNMPLETSLKNRLIIQAFFLLRRECRYICYITSLLNFLSTEAFLFLNSSNSCSMTTVPTIQWNVLLLAPYSFLCICPCPPRSLVSTNMFLRLRKIDWSEKNLRHFKHMPSRNNGELNINQEFQSNYPTFCLNIVGRNCKSNSGVSKEKI